MKLPQWCQEHSLKEFLELLEQKETTMNELITNATPDQIDPNAILLTDEEMEKLLAAKPTEAFVSADDADEAEEDKILN